MPLTDQQIEHLFAFTKKKLVHYYDLQVELVDHLASSIEDEMAADPKLAFEHALQKVYNRFGIFGFAKVVQERENALCKNNRRIWLAAVKQFFTVPKIAFTACVFFACVFLGQFIDPTFKGIVVSALWIAFSIVEGRFMYKARKQATKTLLLTQYTTVFSISGFMFPYYAFVINPIISNNYLFAALMVGVVVVELAVIQVNQQVRKKAMQLYPEAFKNLVPAS
ncbi:hypothetical protein [Aridibaculum aurantiacum]|uniref:hypothetical protein n=1 Tax=Aridibaculum aurantiacum TaxID=2810307 RepID=UPI001A96492F|nr:hypothetical protein [Aridibaculum aurantiacum]